MRVGQRLKRGAAHGQVEIGDLLVGRTLRVGGRAQRAPIHRSHSEDARIYLEVGGGTDERHLVRAGYERSGDRIIRQHQPRSMCRRRTRGRTHDVSAGFQTGHQSRKSSLRVIGDQLVGDVAPVECHPYFPRTGICGQIDAHQHIVAADQIGPAGQRGDSDRIRSVGCAMTRSVTSRAGETQSCDDGRDRPS
jgi:hypothetical protein